MKKTNPKQQTETTQKTLFGEATQTVLLLGQAPAVQGAWASLNFGQLGKGKIN